MSKADRATQPTQQLEDLESRQLLSASTHAATGLTAEYFHGTQLSSQQLIRTDANVNFNWHARTPDSAMTGSFSARWTGQVTAPASGRVTFYTRSDDGVRLWVNGKLIIDRWKDQAGEERRGSLKLVAGRRYSIKLEYYQNAGVASAQLSWSAKGVRKAIVPTSALTPDTGVAFDAGAGLVGTYFSDARLQTPVLQRVDDTIDFSWKRGSSARPTSPTHAFSVRWAGQVTAPRTTTYKFFTNTDDGARLWVNGQLLVDDWTAHATKLDAGSIRLYAGQTYTIKLEYFDNGQGTAAAQLLWAQGRHGAMTVVPAQYLSHEGATTATQLTITSTAGGAVALSWDGSASTGYVVERSTTADSGFVAIGTTAVGVMTFTDASVSPDVVYYYRVIPVGSTAHADDASNTATCSLAPAAPAAPTPIAVSSTEVDVTWSAVADATGYVLQRSFDGTHFNNVTRTVAPAASFSDVGLVPDTLYTYRVVATNAGGESLPGPTAVATTPLGDGPLSLTAQAASASEIDVTWAAVTGATSYTVSRSADGATGWTVAGSVTAPIAAFADTGRAAGSTWYYRVVATTSAGDTDPSPVGSDTTVPATPSNVGQSASAGSVTLTWDASDGASLYKIERSTDGIHFGDDGTTTSTTVTDTGLSDAVDYQYEVIASNAAGDSAPSAPLTATTPPATPTASATAAADTQVNVTWNDVTGETGFVVERSADGVNNWAQVGTTAAGTTTFYNAGLTASTTYYYRVTALDGFAGSAPSAVTSATTMAAIPAYAANNVVYGLSSSNDVYAIDTSTGAATQIGSMAFGTVAGARDPIGGKFYYVETNTSTPRIGTWDPVTNANATLNTDALSAPVLRAAFRRDGTLFVTAGNGGLYTIDRTTGAATSLGTILYNGSQFSANSGDMAFAPDGTLYLACNGTLYSVDTSTLTATLIGDGGVGSTQIAFGDDGTLYASANNNLYTLSLTTGAATLVGASGVAFGDLASVPRYADVAVSQQASPLAKGATGSYTFTVTNAGPDAPTGAVTLTDVLPAGLSFVSATGDGWSVNVSGQTVVLSYAAPIGATATLPPVTITVAVSNAAPASVTNTAVVSSATFDADNSDNLTVLTTPVS